MMRADLHVHSYHSGCTSSLRWYRSRDCYSSPEAVYRCAKARGMDVVTITDHNSIDGCLELLSSHPNLPDFIVGEEVECLYPGTDLRIHIGVLGLDECVHRDLQPLRPNVFEVAAYLRDAGLFFAFNHPFHFFRDQIPVARYLAELLPLFPGIEARNGMMGARPNALSELIAAGARDVTGRLALVGGSDAHTMRPIGTSYTEATADSPSAFLEALKAGRSRAAGRHGGARRLAYEMYGVIFNYWAGLVGIGPHECSQVERVRSIALSAVSVPFMFIPMVVSLAHKSGESRRAGRWTSELRPLPRSASATADQRANVVPGANDSESKQPGTPGACAPVPAAGAVCGGPAGCAGARGLRDRARSLGEDTASSRRD